MPSPQWPRSEPRARDYTACSKSLFFLSRSWNSYGLSISGIPPLELASYLPEPNICGKFSESSESPRDLMHITCCNISFSWKPFKITTLMRVFFN